MKDRVDKGTIPPMDEYEKIKALNYVLGYLDVMAEYQLPKDIEIIKVELMGSRIKGNCTEDSDLDILVEYRNIGDKYWKESHIFNILCGGYYDGLNYSPLKMARFLLDSSNELSIHRL